MSLSKHKNEKSLRNQKLKLSLSKHKIEESQKT